MFVVNVPIGLLALLLAARHLPARTERGGGGLDPVGQVLGVLGADGLLTFGLIEGGAQRLVLARCSVPLVAFPLAAAAFVVTERRTAGPMLPLGLFRSRTFSGPASRASRSTSASTASCS